MAEEEHGPPSAMNPGKHSPSEPPVGTSDDGIKPKQNTESPVRIKPEPTPDADPAAGNVRFTAIHEIGRILRRFITIFYAL